MHNFNGINGGFVIIDFLTLSKITGVNTSFKLFYFCGGIIFLFKYLLKIY